ncbi:MAG TPA: MarR family transcriptional regulator, partial [Hyphomicrobiales bacterium]|nr:MarR family transcriptional regulator [Hyphomicrobiales bacterium]
LEQAGYLTKTVDESDRRLLKLELTQKGAALLSEIVPIAKAFQEEFVAVLGSDFDVFQASLSTLMSVQE